ncbi:MAG: DEAD/DEAH box helicase, partial [Phycisphaerales bacterium JB038]
SGVTEAAKAVNAEFVLALTGTPVENRLADLWSIGDLVQPGRLGSLKEFSRRWESSEADLEALGREILEPKPEAPALVLRRLKEDHLEGLPEKREVFEVAEMPPRQADAYSAIVGDARGEDAPSMLKTLGDLRRTSLHPGFSVGDAAADIVAHSSRMQLAVKWLENVQKSGEKALVFVEDIAIQAVMARVASEILGTRHPPLIINGSVAAKLRQDRVDEFQRRTSGFDFMVLSPRAAGVGLTITAANHVIHLSRWWNPAVEDQCTDRAFRIGQKRDVFVYYPVARHPEIGDRSFDHKLDELIRRKRRMSRDLLAAAAMTPEDRDDLYRGTVA